MHQYPFSARGSAPDTAGGAYDASPDPLVGWRDVPLPIPFLPRRFRRLDLVTAPNSIGHTNKKTSGYTYVVSEEGARMIFLQGGPKFEVTPLILSLDVLVLDSVCLY